MTRRSYLLGLTLALSAVASNARAQTPITNNEFRVDLSQGLVLSGSRIIGIGGAFTALATGIDGASYNPASYAARDMWEHRRFAWGISLGLSFPGKFGTNDYFNSSTDDQELKIDDSYFIDAGLRVQVGYGGGGVLGTMQVYQVQTTDAQYFVRFDTVYMGAAAALLRESLIIGAGLRVAHFQIRQQGVRGTPLVALAGFSPEVGVLIRPEGRRFRIGAAVHLPVEATVAGATVSGMPGTEMVGNHYVPRSVNLPWQVNVGVAFQFGERPMNVHWVARPDPEARANDERDARRCARISAQLEEEANMRASNGMVAPMQPVQPAPGPVAQAIVLPHPLRCTHMQMPQEQAFWAQESEIRRGEDERFDDRVSELSSQINLERWRAYDATPRRYVILSMDVGVTGTVSNAIGVDAFLDQDLRPRATRPTPIIAVGFEAEPWRNRLKLRMGSYLEPARNLGGDYRVHATGGFDLRLFRWALFPDNPWDFRVGFMYDVAPQLSNHADRFANFGITAGLWH